MRLVRATAERIREIAGAEKPHLIHAHSPALNGLAALQAARDLHLPVVYEVRAFWEDAAVSNGTTRAGSLRYRLTRALETHVLKSCAAATVICQGLKDDIAARGIPAGKITLVPNAIDLAAFPLLDRANPSAAAAALRERLQLGGKTVLGFLGSFYPYEGLDLLIGALRELRGKAPDISLLLVGGGQCETELRAQAASLGLDDIVRFVGRVPQSEILVYYALVGLFVFPRRASRLTETVTPLKPLEALATGGIVLASDVGGHREFILEGARMELFAPDDRAAIVAAVEGLIARKESWPALRAEGRAYVEAKRTWASCASGYEIAYARALDATKARE
jgi:PEP-CTERM/exosortase A-associated glycosyltransferase